MPLISASSFLIYRVNAASSSFFSSPGLCFDSPSRWGGNCLVSHFHRVWVPAVSVENAPLNSVASSLKLLRTDRLLFSLCFLSWSWHWGQVNGVACFAGSLFGVPSGEVFSSVSPYSMDMYLSLFFLVHIRHLLSPPNNAKALEKQKKCTSFSCHFYRPPSSPIYRTQFDKLGPSAFDKIDTKMIYISIIIFPNTVPTPPPYKQRLSR